MDRLCLVGNLRTNEVRKAIVKPEEDEEVVLDKLLVALGYKDCVWAIFKDAVHDARKDLDFNRYMEEQHRLRFELGSDSELNSDAAQRDTRWFIGTSSADGDAYFPVELSKPEYDAVMKFIDAQNCAVGEPFSGHFGLLNDGVNFVSKELAENFINEVYID